MRGGFMRAYVREVGKNKEANELRENIKLIILLQ